MAKFKVLVLSSDNDGVGYYRVLTPHICLSDPDIQVDIRMLSDSTLPIADENFLAQYKIIFYNKSIPFPNPEMRSHFEDILRKYNIKLVYDTDDYWILTNAHPNYRMWKDSNAQAIIENELMRADAVTTTTEYLAGKIRELNPNVFVVPNAVNLKEQQWVSNKKTTDKVRFLWGGGITHLVDLRLLQNSFERFDKKFLENAQIYLCGFDLRMNTPMGMKIDDIRRSTWSFFESIFTYRGKWLNSKTNPTYPNWLSKGDDNGRDNYGFKEEFKDEFYQRRWTKPILLYGTMYNEADVVLSPLKNNTLFNQVKSQLKVIEAGAHHCPIICSKYGPYTIDDIEGKKDGKPKGILIDESNDPSLKWYESMKFYLDNPDKIKEHGENLHEYVKYNYDIDVINQRRIDLYKNLANS